ncbi:hypothetical protein L3X38_008133 [Prunus dulcis]|uniref:Retroviral polymerase SH3-like domain-containing protein n=1 Tax=Prunus dulcis TaxID=3755 RepID=A0AAD4ZVU1_PRUDU|nr:hypothetical protein L3X38_008133 [Prunus dulcis]
MSGTPTILSLIADSQKHAINPADPTIWTRASITTTKGSSFHTSSQKAAWIIDSGATDHMTFDHSQLISLKSSTLSVVFDANGKTIGCDTRRGKLYYLDCASDSETKYPKFSNTTSNTSSPYPNTSHPKPGTPDFWLCCFVHLHDHQQSKLDPRAKNCVFIGYAPHQK